MRGLLSMKKIDSSFLIKVLPRVCLIFLVCFSLVAFSCYTAPKAQAEAVTLSLTTAFLMLTIAVMATLGVTLTAPTNQSAIDYISDPFISFLQGKGYSSISDYLASVGISAVTQLCIPVFGAVNIVKGAYDIIAEFCTSFFADNEVVSGGDDVGELPGGVSTSFYGNASLSWNSSTLASTSSSWSWTYGTWGRVGFVFTGDFPASLTISLSSIPSKSNGVRSAFVSYVPAGSTGYSSLYFRDPLSSTERTSVTIPRASSQIEIVFSNQYRTSSTSSTYYASGSMTNFQTNITFSKAVLTPAGFVISPSASVLAPPSVGLGQTYQIPSSNTRADDDTEKAINDVVAPLTATGGLSKTASVTGSEVSSDLEWLYEDTQAIRNNTNPHFDFIPSALGFDFAIWHYVVEMMTSVSDSFALLGTFINNMPAGVLVFPFGVFALAITVALLRRFLS